MFKKIFKYAASIAFISFLLIDTPSVIAVQLLYNGIELPDDWPPKKEALTRDPMPVPYLTHRPKVVNIDLGRQLLVDDFLIEDTSLKRSWHQPQPLLTNPVVTSDRPWEFENAPDQLRKGRKGPHAIPFSDGVWYDPKDNLFKMWYMAGLLNSTCYATSKDGVQWDKTPQDIRPATNVVQTGNRDASTIWLDLEAKDPAKRFKMFRFQKQPKRGLVVQVSQDGIHWSDPVAWAGECYDRTTVFYNPFRKKWIFSAKGMYPQEGEHRSRVRRYFETDDPLKNINWGGYEAIPYWFGADRLDTRHPDRPDVDPQLYNLDAVAYESLMLGLFTIWKGSKGDDQPGRPKYNEVYVGFSRDGYYWDRACRQPFLCASGIKGSWNWGNVQSVGGGCLVVGDDLYFYYSGRAGSSRVGPENSYAGGDASTGLAVLRRDGFASLDANGSEMEEGSLTTRPVRFSGKHLFVNVDMYKGKLWAEVLDLDGNIIEPFNRENSIPIRYGTTIGHMAWKDGSDLSRLAGRPVRFRFYLRRGHLYAFWVSPNESGASCGYVAAGGPGFTGPTDTVGKDFSTANIP